MSPKKNKKKFQETVCWEKKYEKFVSECNKLVSLIKNVVDRNITILKKQEYDDVRIEYG